MRLELTRVGLLVELANHYTTRGALAHRLGCCTEAEVKFELNDSVRPVFKPKKYIPF